MFAWFSDNVVWLLPAIAGVALFAGSVHSRADRGESLPRAILTVLMPFLDENNVRARQFFWVDVFGKVFFVAIVAVILIVGYWFY